MTPTHSGRRVAVWAALLFTLLATFPLGAQQAAGLRAIGGVQLGTPLGVSIFAAAVWDRGQHTWPLPEGLFAGGEVGALGAIATVGHVWAHDGGGTLIQGGVMRRWTNRSLYVGGDARFMVLAMHFTGGAYVRVLGTRGWAMLPVAGFGIGF